MSIAGHIREMGGGDDRQWCSYGIVEPDGSDGQHSVRFNDENGNPLAHGVLVDVKLQPSGIVVPCRVMSQCAGAGEGEYHPFVAGDEVMVLIPEGNERAGCAIVGRFNQVHDVFPTMVAGQDVTTNTMAFKRLIAPYCIETAGGYTIRNAVTGSSLTVDQMGQWFMTDGDGSQLVLTPTVVQLMTPNQLCGIQFNVADSITLLKSDTASLVLDDSSGSKWQSDSTLSISACGNPGLNHVTTVEGMVQFMNAVLLSMGAVLGAISPPIPIASSSDFLTLLNPGTISLILEAAIPLAGSPASSFAPYILGIQAALLIPKVPGVNAGIGSPGFLCD